MYLKTGSISKYLRTLLEGEESRLGLSQSEEPSYSRFCGNCVLWPNSTQFGNPFDADRAEVRGRKRRRIQEEEELVTSSIVQVRLPCFSSFL